MLGGQGSLLSTVIIANVNLAIFLCYVALCSGETNFFSKVANYVRKFYDFVHVLSLGLLLMGKDT